ncbi:MAG TPA: trypsin-like peptidase domain-containing protein [Candidatus Babeliales bacterium]|jgi:serine protease Do|nr:trypsin-like peptidase domain-containing protein [Candidatus Babeliales bacterium]
MVAKNSVCISVCGAVVLFLSVSLVYIYKNQLKLQNQWEQSQSKMVFTPISQTNPHIAENMITTSQLWRSVQDRVRDTVVQLFVQLSAIDLLEPYKTPQQGSGCGSGFFINDEGYLITNAHVVISAKTIWGQIPSLGKHIIDMEVIGMSPERDLALLRVTQEGRELITKELGGIPYLPLGDSDLVRRSDDVLALGYPLGQQSVKSTNGIISGHEHHLIQMSAPINPGSSGGPLLNIKGEVIGVNSSGITEAQNVGYAIPINTLKTILNDLYDVKILRKPFLGVRFNNSTETLTKFLGNPLPGGCYVIETIASSPLEKAGVMRGDMIYEINGHAVDMYGDMSVPWSEDKISIIDYPIRLAIGDNITIVAFRKGQKKQFTVTLELPELQAIRSIYPGYETIDYEIFGGMVVQELNVNLIRLLGDHATGLRKYGELKNQSEPVLIITHVFPDTQLYRGRNLPIGATLNEINGTKVKSLADFRQVIKNNATKEYFTIAADDNVSRAAETIFIVLDMHKIIDQEARLARDYRYQLSDTVKEVLKIASAEKALSN